MTMSPAICGRLFPQDRMGDSAPSKGTAHISFVIDVVLIVLS